MRPRAGGFRCRILDEGLFVLNLSGSCGSVMTHLSLTRESDLLIRVSYHYQTAFDKKARAPDTSLFNWWQ